MNREFFKDTHSNIEIDDALSKSGTTFVKYFYGLLFLIAGIFGAISHTLAGEIMGFGFLGIDLLLFTIPLFFIKHKKD